jgi:hypothetical protein
MEGTNITRNKFLCNHKQILDGDLGEFGPKLLKWCFFLKKKWSGYYTSCSTDRLM